MASPSSLLPPRVLHLGPRAGEQDARTEPGSPGVWILDARDQLAAAERLAPGLLDPAERQRAASYRRSADRGLYVVAHVGLRTLLGSRLGLPAAEVRIGREACLSCGGPHGRPVVADTPVTDGGEAHFSLSHSGQVALIALASSRVGADVEQVPAPEVAEEIGATLHPAETAALAALTGDAKSQAFARTWARKEAYLKGIGIGLSRTPDLDLVGAGAAPAQTLPGWTLRDVRVPDGYAAAVAVAVPPAGRP